MPSHPLCSGAIEAHDGLSCTHSARKSHAGRNDPGRPSFQGAHQTGKEGWCASELPSHGMKQKSPCALMPWSLDTRVGDARRRFTLPLRRQGVVLSRHLHTDFLGTVWPGPFTTHYLGHSRPLSSSKYFSHPLPSSDPSPSNLARIPTHSDPRTAAFPVSTCGFGPRHAIAW